MQTRPFSPGIWHQLPAEVQAYILLLEHGLHQALERMAQLEQEVNELRAEINQHSGNSSLPPSQDPPHAPRRLARKKKSGKSPGGQPGHEGNHRERVPVEEVDRMVEYRAPCCPRCRGELAEKAGGPSSLVERVQIWELPEIRPVVTEHRRLASWCPRCQDWVKAEFPPVVRRRAFGPRLQAWVALLTGRFRQSRRQVADLLQELCGVKVSLGSIQALCEETSEALTAPYQEAAESLAQAERAYVYETGGKERGKRRWLWVAATPLVTRFMISCSRGQKALAALVGTDFQGFIHSDRWSAYNLIDSLHRQVCWAHLKRDFTALAERKTRAGPLGQWALAEIRRIFALWHSYQAQKISWQEMRWQLVPIRARLGRLLRRGVSCGDPRAEALCKNLLKLWPALLTFAFVPGMEPTNNRAERALRGAVLWRKGCFGNQSDNGSRFTERILTVVASLRQQERDIVEFVVEAIKAYRVGQTAPSLVPVAPLLVKTA
jgi:transposase